MSLSDESRERFYTTLAQVPAGKVITYGQLADQAWPTKARTPSGANTERITE